MIALTKFAVKRPVTVILGLITIAYFGFQSLFAMKMELIPEMEMPMLVIATVYPGASPDDITELITKKQEDAITSLDSVDTIQSVSQENVSIVIVQYEYGTNMDTAYTNMKKAMDGIQSQMPEESEEPNIIEMDINAMPAVTLAVSGDVPGNLYTYVDENLVPEFEKLSAVGEVSVAGGQDLYTRVELIPEKLAQYNLSMTTIAQIVGAADFTIPAGDVAVGKQNLDVSVSNDFDSTERLKDVVIPLGNGDIIHLSDVANVYEAPEEESSIGRYNGEDVISISIQKQQSSTALEVSDQVMDTIDEIRAEFPGMEITVVNDSSELLRSSIEGVVQTLIMAVILSMLILFLFYGDMRASVIVGTSIPISVVLSLICMSLMGFTLNLISLTALVLGVGMMVDNSINVLDGCFRAREKLDFLKAAIEGSRTMIGSITGGTVTTCVVFIPLLMMKGLSGQMFTQLGWTIIFCMTASLFSAVIIVPMCYLLWHPVEKEHSPVGGLVKKGQEWYRSHMPKVITRYRMVFGTVILLLVLSFAMASRLGMVLMTSIDEGIVSMTVKTKPGYSVAAIRDTMSDLEEMVAAEEDVDHYLMTFGASGVGLSMGNEVTLNAYLKDERTLSTDEVIEKWRYVTQDYPDVTISIESGSTTMSSSMSSGDQIEVDLEGTDYDLLRDTVDDLVTQLRAREDVMQVHSSVENAAPVVRVRIDPAMAEAEGLTPASIGQVIYSNLSGVTAATVTVNGEDQDVIVEFAPDRYNSIAALQGMMITTGSGTTLPLEDLGEISYEDSPQQISRRDKQYQVAITMQAQAEYKDTAEADVNEFVNSYPLPAGVQHAVNSMDEMMGEEIGALIQALITAVFLVFIVMAIQFESPKFSMMVMMTIPFSLIGSFGLLFLADCSISMTSTLGFLMLVGTVVNNGILYVDTVNQLRVDLPLDQALVEAGAIRLRPILMTTLTTIISMMPNALAYGDAGAMMQDLALVNVGGLSAATLLTLLLLPTFYRVVDKMGKNRYNQYAELDCD